MKWYRATYAGKIEVVEVTRETDKFVVLSTGRRESKLGEYWSYFKTIKEAKHHMIHKFSGKRTYYADQVEKFDRLVAEVMIIKEEE